MKKSDDKLVSAFAKQGGLARARAMTPEQRRESAQKAVQARWARYRQENGIVSSQLETHHGQSHMSVNILDLDFLDEVMNKVEHHLPSPTCPCDECVDLVVGSIQSRYERILEKIDKGEALSTEEKLLFKTLIGEKPDRWTRVFRQERARSLRQIHKNMKSAGAVQE